MTAADRVVAAFGGIEATAKTLRVVRGTVLNWVETGRIPAHRQPAILTAAKALGVKIEPADLVNTEIA